MFFFLSKTLYILLMPITWVILAFIMCMVWKKYHQPFFIAGLAMLLLFTNPFISNALMRWWEVPPVRIATLPQYPVGIVLGGLTTDQEPRDRVHVTGAADRVLQAIHLYRKKKIRKILLTGGSGRILQDSLSEAALLKQILLQANIPARDILMESASRNTHENAVNSGMLLRDQYAGERFLLITSGYHMRRSLACFQQQNIAIDAFSVDQRSEPVVFTPDVLFFPKAEALLKWEVVIREMVGMLTYWVVGYV